MLTQETRSLEFSRSDARIAELLELVQRAEDLKALNDLAEWDQNTQLPEADGAGELRGHQMATLQGILHESGQIRAWEVCSTNLMRRSKTPNLRMRIVG